MYVELILLPMHGIEIIYKQTEITDWSNNSIPDMIYLCYKIHKMLQKGIMNSCMCTDTYINMHIACICFQEWSIQCLLSIIELCVGEINGKSVL